MSFGKLRSDVIASLCTCDELWSECLANANPAPYCVEDLHFDSDSVWIDIQRHTFSFRGTLSFWARLGSSNEAHGMDATFSVPVSGTGTIAFLGKGRCEVATLAVENSLDLFARTTRRRAA